MQGATASEGETQESTSETGEEANWSTTGGGGEMQG